MPLSEQRHTLGISNEEMYNYNKLLCLIEVAAAHEYWLTIVPQLSFDDTDLAAFSKLLT